MNKPNVHRSIELCVHTINVFGHVRHCREMVLEMAHRSFKHWLEMKMHPDSHINGILRAIYTHWQARVASLVRLLQKGSGDDSRCARRAHQLLLAQNTAAGGSGITPSQAAHNSRLPICKRRGITASMTYATHIPCLRLTGALGRGLLLLPRL